MNNLHIEQDLIPRKQYEQLKESYDNLVIRFGNLLIFWRIVLISIIFIIIYFLSKLAVWGFNYFLLKILLLV
jgi:hypothetical protein